jgi:hypothetical protein
MMIDKILPAQSFLTFDHQNFSEEIGDLFGSSVIVKAKIFSVEYLFRFDLLVHLVSSRGNIGNFSKDHLEEDYTNRPDISLHTNENTFRP